MTSVGAIASAPATLDLAAVRAALKAEGLDGWLLYDFRGINPIAADVTGVARQGGHLATRRWYYLIPAVGEPRALVHAIEPRALAHLPGQAERYAAARAAGSGSRASGGEASGGSRWSIRRHARFHTSPGSMPAPWS